MTYGVVQVQTQLKINRFVTLSHIILVLLYTLLCLLHFNVPATAGKYSKVAEYRVKSAWTFVGGVSDLMITCMLWFIFDEQATSHIFRHSGKSYPVLDIVKAPMRSSVNSIEEEEIAGRASSDTSNISLIGERMIA